MKAKRRSAGILLYRIDQNKPQFFLVHPGGPFWANKDEGSWSIPKGELEADENPLTTAIREFHEETGFLLSGDFIELTPIIQKAGKQVLAWGLRGQIDASAIQSNTFKVEWPPKSDLWKTFPEVDKAEWFNEQTAKEKINPAQVAFIEELVSKL